MFPYFYVCLSFVLINECLISKKKSLDIGLDLYELAHWTSFCAMYGFLVDILCNCDNSYANIPKQMLLLSNSAML